MSFIEDCRNASWSTELRIIRRRAGAINKSLSIACCLLGAVSLVVRETKRNNYDVIKPSN